MGLLPLKGIFPFRLGTTSFIYPADYTVNVSKLSAYLDEIELLLFESAAKSLPSQRVVAELNHLARTDQITYNVHLPIDVDLGASEPVARHRAVDALNAAVERVQPLSPTSYTLHLACTIQNRSPIALSAWQHRTAESMAQFLAQTALPGRQICIETLDYPAPWFLPIIEQFNLSVCLDIGHIINNGFSIDAIFSDFLERTQVFHLHGVCNGRDHLALSHMDADTVHKLAPVLADFRGSVSLEVFSLHHLEDSMHCLDRMLQRDQPG